MTFDTLKHGNIAQIDGMFERLIRPMTVSLPIGTLFSDHLAATALDSCQQNGA
jgi:hypothetical protein